MWTKEQKAVIDSRNSNLLVAAAAGSGKTAVLIERIIELILDKENPIDLDRLLVVTFTNAAASEMRERVAVAIEKALENDPSNAHLQKQIMLLNKAEICTIDSFCGNVVKNNFHVTDLDPNVKMADPTEIKIIASELLNELFEDLYEEENEEFLRLVDWYSGRNNDDSLVNLVLTVNNFIDSSPYPEKWLDESAEYFNLEGKDDDFYIREYLIPVAKDVDIALNNYKEMLASYISEIKGYEKLEKYYAEKSWKYNKLLEISECVTEAISMEDNLEIEKFNLNWEKMLKLVDEALNKKFPVFRKSKSFSEEELICYEEMKPNFDKIKKVLPSEYKKLDINVETIKKENEILYPYMRALSNICIIFRNKFHEKKKYIGVVDFADVAHYALEILTKEEDGKILPSDIALNYREYYSEVFTDEYQDSNLVQEMILSMVSKEDKPNRFMVGDVKQSIYRFRQAMPEIFMEKYESYDLYTDNESSNNKKIMLYKNFRSRAEVLEACNHVFSNIMRKETGELDYTEEERLNTGAEFEKLEGENSYAGGQVEVYLLDTKEDDKEDISYDENDEIEDIEGFSKECVSIANIIYKMVNPVDGQKQFMVYDKDLKSYRAVQYRDIVILMRSVNKKALNLEEILAYYNIPVYSNSGDGYFSTLEVDTMVNLLKVIDNPIQDIALMSVMRSPIFNFDSNELANIRLIDRNVKFYEAMLKLASFENNEEEDCEDCSELYQDSTINLYADCEDTFGNDKKYLNKNSQEVLFNQIDENIYLDESIENNLGKVVREEVKENSIVFKLDKQEILSDVEFLECSMSSIDDYDSYADILNKAEEEGKGVQLILSGEMRKLQCKVRKFIEEINEMREKSFLLSVDEFIWYLLRKTGYYAYVGMLEMGEQRQNNLMLLFERARSYEKTSYKGLFNFINYIERMKSRDKDLAEAKSISEEANVVRVMSIHKSKGLEFPVVIVANSDKEFNLTADESNLSLHQTLGYGPKIFDNERNISFDSRARKKIDEKRNKESIAEEMRILYVAMTRAKEKLIFTARIKDRDKKIDKWRTTPLDNNLNTDSLSVLKAKSYLNWIMPTIINLNKIEKSINVRGEEVDIIGYKECKWSINYDKFSDIKDEYRNIMGKISLEEKEEALLEDEFCEDNNLDTEEKVGREDLDLSKEDFINNFENMMEEYSNIESMEEVRQELDKEFNSKYKYSSSLNKPSSISVSEIKKLLSQDSIEEGLNQNMYEKKASGNLKTPSFIHSIDKSAEFTSAEKGTIFHLAMQLMDFSKFDGLEEESVLRKKIENELSQMVSRNIMTEEEKSTVNVRWIMRFMRSGIFKEILEAEKNDRLYKEKAINYSLRMNSIYKDEDIDESERIMMVGIMDLFYEDKDGNLVLLDYKTDYVANGDYSTIVERYKIQLNMYGNAMEKISGRKVVKKYLYMFSTGKLLDITEE